MIPTNEEILILGIIEGIFVLLFLPGVLLFLLRRHLEPIKSRDWPISVVQLLPILLDLCFRVPGPVYVGCPMFVIVNTTLVPSWMYPYWIRSALLCCNFYYQDSLMHDNQWFAWSMTWIHQHRWLVSIPAQLLLCLSFYLFGVTAGLIFYFEFTDPVTCATQGLFEFQFTEGIIIAAGILPLLYPLWRSSDGYLIKFEMTVCFVVGVPALIMWLIANELGWRNVLAPNNWVAIVEIASVIATIWVPLIASFRLQQRIHTDNLKATEIDDELLWILHHPELKVSFERYTRHVFTFEHLLFVYAVDHFHQVPEQDLKKEAEKIASLFIFQNSRCEINIESSVRKAVEKSLQFESITVNFFDEIQAIVFQLLRESIVPMWKASTDYRTILKKLGASNLSELKEKEKHRKPTDVERKTSLAELELQMVSLPPHQTEF